MPTKVKIPVAIFEYSVGFNTPVIALWLDRAAILQALFNELSKWKIDIDGVEPITTGKPSEQGVRIKLPEKKITIFFGPSTFKFRKENSSWDSAPETIEILNTAASTLRATSTVEFGEPQTAVHLHLQPVSGTFLDILRPFLSPALERLRPDKIKTGASVVKWEKGRVYLDGSATIANAVYLLFERTFPEGSSYKDMAAQLRIDETEVFNALDVEEDSQ